MKKSSGSVGNNGAAPSSWPIYALVSTVSMACYLNGLNGDFVHDDIPAVTLNKDVTAGNPLGHVFRNDFWGTPMEDVNSHKSYRPLTTLTFRANYLCFGLDPIWFHITNVLLHAAAASLFTKVCLHIAALKAPFATLAGLMFAAHPIHTEAVTGIVGRADVLACVFFLLSLLAYHGTSKPCIWTSIVGGALSMLAKETGITVFLVNFAYDFYRNWPNIKKLITEVRWTKESQLFANRAVKVSVSLILLVMLRLAMLQGSLPRFSQQDNPAAFHPSLLVRIMTFCHLAALNWWLLLCPVTLSHDWQMGSVPLITSLGDSRNLITCFFFGIAFAAIVKAVSDFENQRNAPLVLGLLLLVVPFLPAANLVVTVGFVIAERVLYIPSMGFILITVCGVQKMWKTSYNHRQTIVCFLAVLLATNCFKCVIRNKDWKCRESLLRAGISTLPNNAKMHYNFGNFLRDSSRFELAKSHYYTALSLWPTYASAHNNLGTILKNQNEAEKHFKLAIRFSENHLNAHYNLGQLYRKLNQSDGSQRMLYKCLEINDKFTPAYIELARLRGPRHRGVGALLEKVARLNPTDPYYVALYAQWLFDKKNYVLSAKYFWDALRVSVTYRDAWIGAKKVLRKLGQRVRLLQAVTRFQLIQRLRRGENRLNPHFYLQAWHLKSDLKSRSAAYYTSSPPQESAATNQIIRHKAPLHVGTGPIPKWTAKSKHHNKTKGDCKQCGSDGSNKSKEKGQHQTSAQVIAHHMLDSILNSIAIENIKYTIQ